MPTITKNITHIYRNLALVLLVSIMALTACSVSSDAGTSPPAGPPTVSGVTISADRTSITVTYTDIVRVADSSDQSKIKVYHSATSPVEAIAANEQTVSGHELAPGSKGVKITLESALASGYIKVKVLEGAVTDTSDEALAEYLSPVVKVDLAVTSIINGSTILKIVFNEDISLATPWAATEASKYTVKTGASPSATAGTANPVTNAAIAGTDEDAKVLVLHLRDALKANEKLYLALAEGVVKDGSDNTSAEYQTDGIVNALISITPVYTATYKLLNNSGVVIVAAGLAFVINNNSMNKSPNSKDFVLIDATFSDNIGITRGIGDGRDSYTIKNDSSRGYTTIADKEDAQITLTWTGSTTVVLSIDMIFPLGSFSHSINIDGFSMANGDSVDKEVVVDPNNNTRAILRDKATQ